MKIKDRHLLILVTSLLVLVSTLFVLYASYIYKGRHYETKFMNVTEDSAMKTVQSEWGIPDKVIVNKNEVFFFYDKDWLNIEQFVFIFNKNDSILVRKAIDD